VSPVLIAAALIIWAVIVALTRYVSLAVLTIVLLVSLFIIVTFFLEGHDPIYIAYVLVPAMVFYRHRANIRALLSGTERRLGERPN
jgi:glycerol-3-phosphate acyltransferase PlsY